MQAAYGKNMHGSDFLKDLLILGSKLRLVAENHSLKNIVASGKIASVKNGI